MIVLDASAAVQMFLGSPRGRRVQDRLGSHAIHVPELLSIEVIHALRRLLRLDHISLHRASAAVYDLVSLDAVRYAHDPLTLRTWRLRDSLSAYDALYVALAETLDCSLVTCDGRLARSTGHRAEIELVG